MTTKRFFYRRRFLNRRGFHAGAYVLAICEVETRRLKDGESDVSVDSVLTIADCGRITTLDFGVYDAGSARNALYKARLLRDTVVEFTEALERAIDERHELSR